MPAPVIDNPQIFSFTVGAATQTFSYTGGSGANRVLVVFVHTVGNVNVPAPSGVTYAGVSLVSQGGASNAGNPRVTCWTLVNPATGANNLIVSWGGVGSGAGDITCEEWTGVDTAGTPFGTLATGTGASAAPSSTATSATGEMVTDGVAQVAQKTPAVASTLTVGSGQTQQENHQIGTTGTTASSTEPGAASVVMDWSSDKSTAWAAASIAVKPAIDAAPELLGVPFGLSGQRQMHQLLAQ